MRKASVSKGTSFRSFLNQSRRSDYADQPAEIAKQGFCAERAFASTARELKHAMYDNAANLKVLFLCDANRLRSPTAEAIFSSYPGVETRSAGVGQEATVPVTIELLEWADLIFVMEKRQRNLIQSRFKGVYQTKRIICLYIPDKFEFMDPDLIQLLEERAAPYLERNPTTKSDEQGQ